MKRLAFYGIGFVLLLLFVGCNQWVRPAPERAHVRNLSEQRNSAVFVEMTCAPFAGSFADDGPYDYRTGTGVMVSDWQVLTALHVVDCQSAVPTIYVTTFEGDRYRFAPEEEWRKQDIARIQMASADSFKSSYPPPAVRVGPVEYGELLFIERLQVMGLVTSQREVLGESVGGSDYHAPTGKGWSGAGVYDMSGYLVGIHLSSSDVYQHFGRIEKGMVP